MKYICCLCCKFVSPVVPPDELHMVADPTRGPPLEHALAKLLHCSRARDLQLLGMSATMGGACWHFLGAVRWILMVWSCTTGVWRAAIFCIVSCQQGASCSPNDQYWLCVSSLKNSKRGTAGHVDCM